MDPLPSDLQELLAGRNPAVIATLRASGRPVTVPTWYEFQAPDRVLVNMDAGRVRLRHLRRDPRVSLTVLEEEHWYRHVSFIGTVDRLWDDEGYRDIDRLAMRYIGMPYQSRGNDRVSGSIRIESWHAWDARSFTDDGRAEPIR